jgi:hypothetical protein
MDLTQRDGKSIVKPRDQFSDLRESQNFLNSERQALVIIDIDASCQKIIVRGGFLLKDGCKLCLICE